jgi:hypothetical protein
MPAGSENIRHLVRTPHVLFLALDFLLVALALGVVFVVATDGPGAELPSYVSFLQISNKNIHPIRNSKLPLYIMKYVTDDLGYIYFGFESQVM